MSSWRVRQAVGMYYPWEIVGTSLVFRTEAAARTYALALNRGTFPPYDPDLGEES